MATTPVRRLRQDQAVHLLDKLTILSLCGDLKHKAFRSIHRSPAPGMHRQAPRLVAPLPEPALDIASSALDRVAANVMSMTLNTGITPIELMLDLLNHLRRTW